MKEIYEFVRDTEAEIQRRLGKPNLTVELVPRSCWCSNVRTVATKDQWDTLRKATYKHYSHRCAVCGGKGPKWPVECHEMWQYDILPKGNTQKLRYLIALCPSCHEVKHFGRAQMVGRAEVALSHLMAINEWPQEEAVWYLQQVSKIFGARSEIVDWALDLSWVGSRFDIKLDTTHRGGHRGMD